MVGCERAAERIVLTSSAALDPGCEWTGGVDITASGVTLDCAGATIRGEAGAGGRGIAIVSPVEVAQTDVTVRGCTVRGFLNSIRVTRDGFRDLAPGREYDATTARIVLEGNDVGGSRGVGIFVDGYVSDVTIRRNRVAGAGSSGIYLEAGSRDNAVVDNEIVGNGGTENGPGGQTTVLGGVTFWYWGTGREGLSIDGSRDNVVTGNRFVDNAAGGIFLYENCGEYHRSRPGSWFERRYGADGNRIEANTFVGGRNGVWVGSRMGESTAAMECSDEPYLVDGITSVTLDRAVGNRIVANRFRDVTYGVRVEDDDTLVEANTFEASSPDHHAVIVGTPHRTAVLHRPVTGTVLRANASAIAGNPYPYRWVHGERGSTLAGNTALGHAVGWCEGRPIPREPLVMVVAVAPAGPGGERPATPDLTIPLLGALPPCPTAAGPSTTGPTATGAVRAAGTGVGTAPAAVARRAAPAYTG